MSVFVTVRGGEGALKLATRSWLYSHRSRWVAHAWLWFCRRFHRGHYRTMLITAGDRSRWEMRCPRCGSYFEQAVTAFDPQRYAVGCEA